MPGRIDNPDAGTRSVSAGRAFVYVLPCAYDEILKLGFSRDPLVRMQTLHQRYFEFFDIERAFLVETDLVRDARHIERELANAIALHRAPAPLVVREEAGGHTEWYRGAYPLLLDAANTYGCVQGYALHLPLRKWLSTRLEQQGELLYEWASRMFSEIGMARNAGMPVRTLEKTLRNALDAFGAFELDLAGRIPGNILHWYDDVRSRAC